MQAARQRTQVPHKTCVDVSDLSTYPVEDRTHNCETETSTEVDALENV